jgi:hypothetical protein
MLFSLKLEALIVASSYNNRPNKQVRSAASMHLAHSQSTGTAAPARNQKLRRPQILGSNVQNNSSFRYKDAVTSFFRSGQV